MLKTVRRLLAGSEVQGTPVTNPAGEDLGKIKDVVIDRESGRIAYAVLSFSRGLLGLHGKLFAVPWQALRPSAKDGGFVIDIPRERLEEAPGFDRDHWPDFTNPEWGTRVHTFFGMPPHTA